MLNRRNFLVQSSLAAASVAGVTLAFERLTIFAERNVENYSHLLAGSDAGSYGSLRPTKSQNTGEILLALPEGFSYTAFGQTGSKMSDGNLTPAAHDGMAAFAVNGQLRLVRNHEISGKPDVALGAASKFPAYDPTAGGGTTTLIIDPKTRLPIKEFISLSGTLNNCAGGPTPWGSWISCEETTLGETKFTSAEGKERGGFAACHGYCFEVSASANSPVTPTPMKAMGRFVHEAIAVDERTGIVYLTEDQGTAGLYRFIPKQRGKLNAGGKLQMLAIANRQQADLRTKQTVGQVLTATWVDILDPDPAAADTDTLAVYKQGFAQGAATFARLEGIWYGSNSLFFTSTSGGENKLGQVWQYTPQSNDKGALKLIFESPAEAVLDMPDNLCISPRGGLVLCEDGHNEQFVRGLTKRGQIFDFAKNIAPGFDDKEFAGACFSPDGNTLFLNIQTPGITMAIWGDWQRGAL